jgi:DNA polymerase III subunit delta'
MPFRDVIGHRRIVALLARSVARDSLPPSLIFAGPAGIGKRLTATALAQALNCLNTRDGLRTVPYTETSVGNGLQAVPANTETVGNGLQAVPLDACGVCAACTRIARGIHPDVLVLEPGDTGSIRIEQVREVVDRAAYRPFEGRRRVVIINEADALVPAAQNALLKTLEEPPSMSVFILVTARPDVLLPTVRSRCVRLWFAEGATEDIDVEAREVAQQVLAHAASTPDLRRRIEGAKDLLANTGSGGASDRAQLSVHLRAMGSLLRDIALLATRADAGRLANPDVRPALDRLTQTYKGARGIRAFAAVDGALAALERNAGVKIVADWLVLQL